MKLKNKIALVLGAVKGIGPATAPVGRMKIDGLQMVGKNQGAAGNIQFFKDFHN